MKNLWPILSYEHGRATYRTLHLWTQIVGKIKLACMPPLNHSWNVTLYVTPRGLTTRSIPYQDKTFQIDFNLLTHQLEISTSDEDFLVFSLLELSVAGFYERLFELLARLGIDVMINPLPAEMSHPVRFDLDHTHRTYIPEQVNAFHKALIAIQNVFEIYRAEFTGKASPIQLFWGGFDLSLALFSGRRAPRHPGKMVGLPDAVLQDSYSHEICETGFSLGSKGAPEASFYCSLYPEPANFAQGNAEPGEAAYNSGSFNLPYKVVQTSQEPEEVLLSFLRSTYRLASACSDWDTGLYSRKD
ncbi:DUF5996 family protein [Pedobacter sp.]|uniref:DUF5996 family protein n=1 Tax=Pedobacter sp. TaxID=1411316 RepID=UPI003C4AB0A8